MYIYIKYIYIKYIYILIDILDNIKYQKYVCVYIYNKLNLGNNNILKLASVYIYIILCIYIYVCISHNMGNFASNKFESILYTSCIIGENRD
jgi:hypothetical protein